jgi:nucleotide-binding universal stress UspA family protein
MRGSDDGVARVLQLKEDMLERILVALDGSELAEESIPWVLALADAPRLVLVRVVRHGPADSIHFLRADRESRKAREYLEGAARRRAPGAAVEVRTGSPAAAILEAGGELGAGLIAIVSRVPDGIGRRILGGTAENLIRASERPILVVPGHVEAPMTAGRVGLIVVPLDGSEASESALPPAEEVARRTGASVLIVHARPAADDLEREAELLGAGGADPETIRASIVAAQRAAEDRRRRLAEVAERLVHRKVHADVRVIAGDPGTEIPRLVRREAADMIVMSTHGYGAVRRLLLGSVAWRLIEGARVPVLATRREID